MTTQIGGTTGITFPDASTQNTAATGFGFKNRIINGSMMIDQRNAGASFTPTSLSYFTLDRWSTYLTQASKFTVQQNAGSVTPPTGFINYLGVTSSSAYSITSSDYFSVNQLIEGLSVADFGWGTASAATVTLSFWVRSSLTGTFGGALRNASGARSYPFSYTVSSANTWENKTITIPGDTSGTWLTTNGIGIYLSFGIGVGSTYSGTAGSWSSGNYVSATGATSVVGTNGATFYITGVQLEKGSTATSFDYRPYGTELQLCQRYYFRIAGNSSGNGYASAGTGYSTSTTNALLIIPIPVSLRTTSPTLGFGGTISLANVLSTGTLTGFTTSYTGNGSIWASIASSGGGLSANYTLVAYTQNAASNYIDVSAEL